MKRLMWVPVLATLLLSGCVVGTRNVALTSPEYASGKSASGPVYIGTIVDNRTFEQKPKEPSTPSVDGELSSTPQETLSALVGRQRNSYGRAMGDIALPEGATVQDRVRDLLASALRSRGYDVVDDPNAPNTVSVVIEKFWAWFTPGMWTVGFEADLKCGIDFATPSGKQTFDVVGYGLNRGQGASNANWELAYQRAFEDFLKNLDGQLDSKGL